jgi:hypothetical protein
MKDWPLRTIADLVTLQRGIDLPDPMRQPGAIPIMGSFGITGRHGIAACKGPGVTVGRSGASIGTVSFIDEDYWPLNSCLYVVRAAGTLVRPDTQLAAHRTGLAEPGTTRCRAQRPWGRRRAHPRSWRRRTHGRASKTRSPKQNQATTALTNTAIQRQEQPDHARTCQSGSPAPLRERAVAGPLRWTQGRGSGRFQGQSRSREFHPSAKHSEGWPPIAQSTVDRPDARVSLEESTHTSCQGHLAQRKAPPNHLRNSTTASLCSTASRGG